MAPRRAHLWGASPVRVPDGRRRDPSCLRGGAGVHAHQRIGGGFLVASGMNSRHQDHASQALTPHLGVSPPTDCHLPPGAGSPSAQSAPFPFPLLLLTAHEAVHHPGLHVTCGWGTQILFYLISEKPKPTLTARSLPACVCMHTHAHTRALPHAHTPQLLSWEFSPSGLPGPQVTAAVSPVGSSGPWSALRPPPQSDSGRRAECPEC